MKVVVGKGGKKHAAWTLQTTAGRWYKFSIELISDGGWSAATGTQLSTPHAARRATQARLDRRSDSSFHPHQTDAHSLS